MKFFAQIGFYGIKKNERKLLEDHKQMERKKEKRAPRFTIFNS